MFCHYNLRFILKYKVSESISHISNDMNKYITKGKLRPVKQINNLVRYMEDRLMFPSIFFSYSRKRCEEYAKLIDIDIEVEQNLEQSWRLLSQRYKDTASQSYPGRG